MKNVNVLRNAIPQSLSMKLFHVAYVSLFFNDPMLL